MNKKVLISILVVMALLANVASVFAAAPDGAGPYADFVEANSQGLRKDGTPVLAARSNPNNALGAPDYAGSSILFYSLGFGGSITLGFDNYVCTDEGMDVKAYEVTNGTYPEEVAEVYVSQNNSDWSYAGDVNNKGTFNVDLPDTLYWVKYVKLVDKTNPALHASDADGYDLDAVEALHSSPDMAGCLPPNYPPIADPNGPYLGAVNTPIPFDGTGSSDPDTNLLTYSWDFGDNSMDTGEMPSHEYTVAGIYDVCLTVNDGFVDSAEVCTYAVIYDPSGGFVTGGGWIWSQSGQTAPIYNSIPATMPGSFPSLGYEATSTDEAGDHVAFVGTDRGLQSVTVSLTNWACENDFDFVGGTWIPNRGSTDACITTPGSGFNHPITLNIYEVDNSGATPAVGALITSKTETFFIPFRPSWDSTMCTGSGENPATDVPFGGRWYDPVLGACVHGYAFNIDFDFSTDGITLPNEVIYGVAYNTANHGATPLGVSGPYSSLNLSLTADVPAIGTDVEPGTLFWDTSHGPFYCDGGAGGTDTFRRDAGCWAPYTPVVQFNVQTGGAYKLDPSLEGKATFGFVSKYKKGASVPEGNTQFQFQAGDLNFHSTSYDWLVVTGSDYAKFKGSGTINGQGDYKFQLWAGDKSPDTFRIKIWYEENGSEVVVYNNGMDQEIGGGSIVVHKAK